RNLSAAKLMEPSIQELTSPVDPAPKLSAKHRKLLGVLLLVLVIAGSYRLGYVSGKKGVVFEPKDFKIINQNDQTATVDYNLLWDALKVVQDKYIDKDNIDQRKVLY